MRNVAALLVYLIAGLATGYQVFEFLAAGTLGVPVYTTEFIALFGAWALDISAFLVFKKKKAALCLAAAGFVGLWTFYGPALYDLLRPEPGRSIPSHVFIAPLFLIAATIYFGFDVFLHIRGTEMGSEGIPPEKGNLYRITRPVRGCVFPTTAMGDTYKIIDVPDGERFTVTGPGPTVASVACALTANGQPGVVLLKREDIARHCRYLGGTEPDGPERAR